MVAKCNSMTFVKTFGRFPRIFWNALLQKVQKYPNIFFLTQFVMVFDVDFIHLLIN